VCAGAPFGGPEGGVGGGMIVAATDPEGLVKVRASHTGRALEPVLARGGAAREALDEAQQGAA